MNGIIAVDIGTTSLRATLYDAEGKAFPSEQRPNVPIYHPDGRVEQDPDTWSALLPQILAAASARAAGAEIDVAAISVTSQRSSVIPIDRSGAPLAPAIMWQDRRTASLASALAPDNARVHAATGLQISPVFSALKMLWIRRNWSGIYARAFKLMGIQDFILHMLTGRAVTDQSLASRTNLLNLETRAWDASLASLFEVDMDKLCDLVPPGSAVGGLLPERARALGLKAGIPVISAGGDQQCAALGLGLFSSDRAVANTGTGSYILGHAERPVVDPKMRVSTNVAAVPGAYIVESILPTSGTVYRWFKENFWNGPLEERDPWGAINAEAEASGPGAHGLTLIPHFSGSGTPHWDTSASGILCGLSLSTTRGDMARAILEGIAMELAEGFDLLTELLGPISRVQASGGMTNAPLFNQIQADVFGTQVAHFEGGESTSLGAWIAGAVATGMAPSYREAFLRATAALPRHDFDPDSERHQLYGRLRTRASSVYASVAAVEHGRAPGAATGKGGPTPA